MYKMQVLRPILIPRLVSENMNGIIRPGTYRTHNTYEAKQKDRNRHT